MKSLVMKSVYTGLGLLGSGKETIEQLGRKLARQANLSEQDGKKIARQLRLGSKRAVNVLQKTLDAEAAKVVKALQAASRELGGPGAGKSRKRRGRARQKPIHR